MTISWSVDHKHEVCASLLDPAHVDAMRVIFKTYYWFDISK